MNTVQIEKYTFNKVSKKINFTNLTGVKLENIVSITDVTNNVQIFFNKLPGYGGTLDGTELTLAYDTNNSNFNDTDKLLIEVSLDNYVPVLVPEATRSTNGQTDEIVNYGNKGAVFVISTPEVAMSATFTVKLQMQDPVSLQWIDIPGASTAAITAVSRTLLTVYPGIPESANSKVSFPLPAKYRVSWTMSGDIKFSVCAYYIK